MFREYDQARRAYLFALKCDPNNERTMRELLQLQIHLRDFPGFEETSRKLLMLKPSTMQHWVTLAAACYSNRNYVGCLQALESVLKFSSGDEASRLKPTEVSEVVLLALRALNKQGKHAEALTFFNKHKDRIVDPVSKADYLGRIHLALGNEIECVNAYEELL